MSLSPIVLSIPIYFVLIGVELLAERWQHTHRYRFADALTNISCGMTSQVAGVFMRVVGVGAYAFVYEHFAFLHIKQSWTAGILLFVLADLGYYWAHRLSHQINLFWGGHVVHHQSEDYNLSVALRQSSLQSLFTFFVYLPLAVIGFEPVFFVYISALVTLYQFWIHTEFIGRLGPLEWVLNTPSHHRVHHGRNPRYIDKNYAGALIVWDRLFGTFEPETERPVYGITVPLQSWNPLWANVSHYPALWRQVQATPGLANRLRVVFGRPGWRPAEQGGPLEIPPVAEDTYRKYQPTPARGVPGYVLAQYVVLVGVAALFVFTQKSMPPATRYLLAGWIAAGVVAGGGLLENRSWAWQLEVPRLLASLALLVALLWESSFLLWAGALGGMFVLASVAWCYKLRPVAGAAANAASGATA
ncbi:MAG TPA: sterol desaturase family protein [Hymenobacter sp.]|uniref:sterol desaturase family protein n=1 Tax=Hymenobacter sp. TaxID=1898978 RepID=UPI002ED85A7C